VIDTANETICKYCGRPLVQKAGRGHRKRAYCNDAHKMKDRRRQLAEKQQTKANQVQAQLAALEKQVRELEARLAALRMVNERFRNDTQVRAFGSWLEKQARYYSETPFGRRFLDGRRNQVLPPRASRAAYEAIMYHQLGYSAEDIETFREAWREMLKTQV
jgi:hypothetical protein